MFKVILVSLLLSQAALGITRYIATTGNDTTNTCSESTSVSTPKRNFKGASGALACMAAGDTLIVKGGTYTEGNIGQPSSTYVVPSGISDSQRTIIIAAVGETPIIRPSTTTGAIWWVFSRSFITIDGLTFDGTNVSGNLIYIGRATMTDPVSTFITVQNSEISNGTINSRAGLALGYNQEKISCNHRSINNNIHNIGTTEQDHGLYTEGRDILIEGGSYHHNSGHGVHVFSVGGAGSTNNTIVRNIRAYNNGSHGIGLYQGVSVLAYNNLSYDNGGYGVAVRYNCTTCAAYNNTIYSNTTGGVQVGSGTPGVTGTILRNNIIHSNGGVSLSDGGSGTVVSNNLCFTGCFVNEANAANIFTNPGTFDFSLKTGSPAIGNGSNLSSIFTTDYDGITRSVPWDIGAYEYVSLVESITLNTPNGGENWLKTAQQTIAWTRNNFTTTRLRADRGNDGTFEETIIASTSAASYDWTPGGTTSSIVKIEACDAADGTPCDVSNAVFTIADAAGTTVTRIISENTVGSFVGHVAGFEDVRLRQTQSTTNQDTDLLRIFKYASGDHSHGLLKFGGLSQIPTGATIISVTLGLYLESTLGTGPVTFNFHRALRDWSETQATWMAYSTGNNWASPGALGAATDRVATPVFQKTGVDQTLGWVTYTDSGAFKNLFQTWADESVANQGLQVERDGTGNDGILHRFTNSEGTNGQRPYLSVTYSTVTSTISVVEPFSNSHFFAGQTVPIRWGSQGVSGNVQVLLSRDGGMNYIETIDASFPFDGSDFAWFVTRGSCSACMVKVVSLNDPTVFGISAPFRIAGSAVRAR